MILQRYIGMNLVRGWLLTLVVLASVFGLISFMQELDRTRSDYDGLAVARYTLMTLPQQMVSLAPVIGLLGSMVALSRLYQSRELTVMFCSGFSPARLLGAITLPTLLLMAGLWLAMEYVAPQMQQTAEQQRHDLRYPDEVRIPHGGIWATSGGRYTHLGKMFKGSVPGNISVFEFDPEGRLLRALHARKAEVVSGRRWLLKGVREKRLVDGTLVTRRYRELELDRLWAADELPTLTLSPEAMSLSVLFRYGRYLADSDQPAQAYQSQFWQKLMMPLTVGAMVLLATPISASTGAGRDRSFGVKIAIGAVVGILFYLGAQIIFALGHLLNLSPPLIAVLPAILVTICAAILLRRMLW
jgi:lipopolysaccharide export system permease protein